MGNGECWKIMAVTLSFALLGCFQNLAPEGKVPRITKEELKSMLDRPDVIIVDVRLEDEGKNSKWKIKGAVRENPEKEIRPWADKYTKEKTLIFYCSGHDEETSAWVARQFISKGFKNVFALKGGWKEWNNANFPIEPKGDDRVLDRGER